jgi:hypothetical protein
MATAAAIDRLIHHAVSVELNISSFRLEEAQRNQKARPDSKESKPQRRTLTIVEFSSPHLIVAKGQSKLTPNSWSTKNRKNAADFCANLINIRLCRETANAEAEAGASEVISDAKGSKHMARFRTARRTGRPLTDRYVPQSEQKFIAIHAGKSHGQ